MSPTQRTLKWLRDNGHHAAVVERWNAHAGIRQDLFGCIDILAIGPINMAPEPEVHGLMAYQCTSATNMAARRNKILGLAKQPNSPVLKWLEHVGPILVVGWGLRPRLTKSGAKTKLKKYEMKTFTIELGDVEDQAEDSSVTNNNP